ncbi:MAG: DHH family phosphoesterase [Candidatus Wallbacteria bacterium]
MILYEELGLVIDLIDNILEFVEYLKKQKKVFIQTHNFPDHDAIATAYCLQRFLAHFNINASLIYEGDISRDSLIQMIHDFKIDIRHNSEYLISNDDKIILVDGCKGNKNVANLKGTIAGVIDHHNSDAPDDVEFNDIRHEYGACVTIIYSYFKEFKINITHDIATILMIAICIDTASLTRKVSDADLEAYSELHHIADMQYVNKMRRNYMQIKDMDYFKYGIQNIKINGEFAFCYFPDGCNTNLLGIMGDFFLAIGEVTFVALCAQNEGKIYFSLRNENEKWNAAEIIHEILEGTGFGGGHNEMAGGVIPKSQNFDPETIYLKFLKALDL